MMLGTHVSLVNVVDILMKLLNRGVLVAKHSSLLLMEATRTTPTNANGPLRPPDVVRRDVVGILGKVGLLLRMMKPRMLMLRTWKVKI